MLARRNALLASTLCLVGFAASDARAQEYARNGAYLSLAGSLGVYTKVQGDGVDDVEEPLGLKARVGYRLHPRVAAEAEFEWLSEADVDLAGFGTVGTIETIAQMANLKGYLLTGRVQPLLLVGIGAMRTKAEGGGDSDDSYGFAARFGAGVDIYITPNIVGVLDASYVLPTGDLDDLDYVSIGWGFAYRF